MRMPAEGRWIVDGLANGAIVWLIGFVLGAILFPIVPERWFDVVLLPPLILLLYLFAGRRFAGRDLSTSFQLVVGLTWMVMSMVLDQIVIVQVFGTADFYDVDLILFYAFLVVLPAMAARWPIWRGKGADADGDR